MTEPAVYRNARTERRLLALESAVTQQFFAIGRAMDGLRMFGLALESLAQMVRAQQEQLPSEIDDRAGATRH